jgi:hypothetical protein
MGRVEVRDEASSWCGTSQPGCNVTMVQGNPLSGGGLGQDIYTGFSVYLPTSFQPVQNQYFNNIVEWHADASMVQAPIHFFIDGFPATDLFSLDLHTDASGYNPKGKWDFGPMVKGRWVDFVIRVKWARDTSGIVEGWQDGVKKFSSGPIRTWGTQQIVYPMEGYYRIASSQTVVFYLDAFKVGTNYESVAP